MDSSNSQRVPVFAVLLGVMLATASLAATPAGARACITIAPPPTLVGVPEDGATDVPTDVIGYYQYPFGRGPDAPLLGRFSLTTETGQETALTAEAGDAWNFKLVPAQRLAPNTKYELRAEWMPLQAGMPLVSDEVRFTTGAGPLAMPPSRPVAILTNYHLKTTRTSCSPPAYGSCISLDAHTFVIAASAPRDVGAAGRTAASTESYRYGWLGSHMDPTTGNAEPGVCVELRTRALNGALSEPLRLCGEDSPLLEIVGSEQIECISSGLSVQAPGVAIPVSPVRPGASPSVGAAPPAGSAASAPVDAGGARSGASAGCRVGAASDSFDTLAGLATFALCTLVRRRSQGPRIPRRRAL